MGRRDVRSLKIQSGNLSCLGDFPGLNTTGTNLHPLITTLGQGHSDRLQVWIEPAWGAVIGM